MCATCGCMGKKKVSAKSLSPKQKKMAGTAGNPNKIDAADLKSLRKGKKK